ncbi:Kinesin-like protein [Phytophthora cactorum]|nr:Kinesin-like protein [Phytophthora cactorum]
METALIPGTEWLEKPLQVYVRARPCADGQNAPEDMFERKKETPNNIVIKDTERMQYGNHAFSFDNLSGTASDQFLIFGEPGGEKVGLLSRSIEYLFDMVNRQQSKAKEVTLVVSFQEIYCDRVRDLARAFSSNPPKAEEDYDYEKARDSDEVIYGMLNMVDLAGKAKSDGQRLKEALHINSSLSAVGKVVMSLDPESGYNYIPYRDSKLTRLLQNSIADVLYKDRRIRKLQEELSILRRQLEGLRSEYNNRFVATLNELGFQAEEISENGEIKFADGLVLKSVFSDDDRGDHTADSSAVLRNKHLGTTGHAQGLLRANAVETRSDRDRLRQKYANAKSNFAVVVKRRIATLESCLQQKMSEYDRALASEAARHREEMQALLRRNNSIDSKTLSYQQSVFNPQVEDYESSKDREKQFEKRLQQRMAALQKSKENEIALIRQQYEQSLASKTEELNVANNKLLQLQQTTTDTMDNLREDCVELYTYVGRLVNAVDTSQRTFSLPKNILADPTKLRHVKAIVRNIY